METLRLTPAVHDVLRAAQCEGNRVVLAGQLDRKLYVQVDKALKLMGGKWNTKARAHLFEDAAEDVIADAIATGTVLDLKKHFQFFETPPDVAELLVDHAQLHKDQCMLEPSAGRGAIIKVIRARFGENLYLFACELWDKNREALREMGVQIAMPNFFELVGCRPFDRIIANPPFTCGQDVDHVTHMIEMLAPGGRLASVMSPGWRFREDKKFRAFRERAQALGAEWHELPPGSFAASGTNVNAGIIVIQK
jgi:methylase of polypeptide subunit release factors